MYYAYKIFKGKIPEPPKEKEFTVRGVTFQIGPNPLILDLLRYETLAKIYHAAMYNKHEYFTRM